MTLPTFNEYRLNMRAKESDKIRRMKLAEGQLMHPAFINRESTPASNIRQSSIEFIMLQLRQAFHEEHQADDQADLKKMAIILQHCAVAEMKLDDLLDLIGFKRHADTIKRYIVPLEKIGWLEKTIPDKPTSPKQKYRLSQKAIEIMKKAYIES